MNEAFLEALVALVCYGVSDFVYKQAAAGKIRADHFIMVQAWLYCPTIIVYTILAHRFVPVPAALWGSLAGVATFTGLYYFSRSLSVGAVSTNASIFRMNFIVTAFLAIAVLGEPLTLRKAAGLALALLATRLLIEKDRNAAEAGALRTRSLLQVAGATLAFGTANFFHTVGLRHGAIPETLVMAQAALFMPLATTVVFLKDGRVALPPRALRFSAPAAVLQLVATVMLVRSIALGQASVLVPIAQMGLVVAAVLGIAMLGERATLRKMTGLALAVAALAVLAGS
ncbi:MAG TPA: EamA family transporter [Pseudolabrys sp.]|nr:EamA family transporter [Pseudolabrys sp.]